MKISKIRKYISNKAYMFGQGIDLESLDEWLYNTNTDNCHIQTIFNSLFNAEQYILNNRNLRLVFKYDNLVSIDMKLFTIMTSKNNLKSGTCFLQLSIRN